MRLLIQSAIIFFGTLLAAGLLALGEPQASHPGGQGERSHRASDQYVLEGNAWLEQAAVQPAR